MNRDFVEMLSRLSAAGARFLIVGAHALAAHGALRAFGAPLLDLTEADLCATDTVFQIGVPPSRIDILTGISSVSFDDAWPRRMPITIGDLAIATIGRADFITNKKASGRAKDLLDLELLPPE